MKKGNQIAQEIFADSLDVPTRERGAFLDEACHGDPKLRRDVESWLIADKQAGGFLRSPLFNPTIDLKPIEPADSLRKHSTARFIPQDLINGRFRVICFIARGGMGEVYEVEDTLLHDARIALKIIRPEIALNHGAAQRFEQELLMARRVVHANLCPIYELFHCQEVEPPFLFMTMKLLKGQPLDRFLKEHSRLSVEHMLAVCEGMTAAVGALHAADILHRDLKPSNVMIDISGPRVSATIMDFGLARDLENYSTFSQPGLVAGTPGYIAPEILQGAQPTAASDLFALGVMLHELLTQEKPARANGGLDVRVSKRIHSSGYPQFMIRAIEGLIARHPNLRTNAFEQLSKALGIHTAQNWRVSRRNFTLGAGATFFGLLAGVVWKRDQIDDALHPLPLKRFVALLNWPPIADKEMTPMLSGLIDTMLSELSRAEAFDHNFFITAQKTLTTVNTPSQLAEVTETLGANLVLGTSGAIVGKKIHLTLRVLDPVSMKQIRSSGVESDIDQPMALATGVTKAAARLLNISHLQPNDKRNQVGTTNQVALKAYQAGVASLKSPNNDGLAAAVDHFRQAIEADTSFANAYAGLSIAYLRLYDQDADPSAMTLAKANATSAITFDPQSIEGHVALGSVLQDSGHATEALHEMSSALALDPTDTRTMVYQAQILYGINRWQEAVEILQRALTLRPNYWLAYNELGNAYNLDGRYQDALRQFQAASRADDRQALAWANMGTVYFQLGNLEKANAALSKSLSISPTDWAFQTKADMFLYQKRHGDSLEAALQATKCGPEEGMNWLRVGDALSEFPRKAKSAREAYRRAVDAQARKLELNPGDGAGLMLLALYRLKAQEPANTLETIRSAEPLGAQDIFSQLYKVRILELLGKREQALKTLTDCFARGATRYQMDFVQDLAELRTDSIYAKLLSSSNVN